MSTPRTWSAAGAARSKMAAMSSPANFAACVRPSNLDAGLLASIEARRLNEHAQALRDVFAAPALFLRRGDQTQVSGPGRPLDVVMAAGQKGISQIQRYKGLGEMNPDQLWETTLDREARTLLQVKIKEGDDADDIFRQADGRCRRAPARIHPGKRAERRQFGCLIRALSSAEGLVFIRLRSEGVMQTKTFEVTHTDEEWRRLLTPEQYDVMRKHGTEAPGSCALNHEKRQGIFLCAGCGQNLFVSHKKFDSGTGWPSFNEPARRRCGELLGPQLRNGADGGSLQPLRQPFRSRVSGWTAANPSALLYQWRRDEVCAGIAGALISGYKPPR